MKIETNRIMSLNHEEYKSLVQRDDNDDDDYPPNFTTLNEQEKSKWSHIDDLDQFFARVYQYHQNHGIHCLVFMELLNLFQILFLVTFSTYIVQCVNYPKLFRSQEISINLNNTSNSTIKKRTIDDIVYPLGVCVDKFDFWLWSFLIIVLVFWIFRLIKAAYNIARYIEIKSFYSTELHVHTPDLPNITWHEIQEKLLNAQKRNHLCVHKQELTELDIYNRILRFKNYEVAMMNQNLLPPRVQMPVLGELIMFSTGFKYNFEFLLFWGPFAPFSNGYQLRPEYKVQSKRDDLGAELSKWILILGVFNLVLSPVIFVWQLLQFFYNYTELIKRDPSVLGTRKWSNYGKLYFRHFNELDHELEARLSRAYRPASIYVNSFVSKFLVLVAKFFVFTFGAVFAILIVLTVYDEDVLNVEHILTVITISGAIVGIARSLIPDDEQAIYFVDQLMFQILAQVHYMPDRWKNHPHSLCVRGEFVRVFQYKFVYIIEQLLSPFITPFLLLFWLRPRSLDLVDFFRNFTIDVVGVGDVCSFSQMDTQRHGNVKWFSRTKAKPKYQAKNGKTELSLIHFSHTNPNWKMPKEAVNFMDQIKEQANSETTTMSTTDNTHVVSEQHSLTRSIHHLQSLIYNSQMQTNLTTSNAMINTLSPLQSLSNETAQKPKGAVSRLEGPLFASRSERQTLLAIAQVSTLQLSGQAILPMATSVTNAVENSLDMSFSALYMHELHRKYHHGDYLDLEGVNEENSREDDEECTNDLNSDSEMQKFNMKPQNLSYNV